ncbi:MAG: DUF1501 domain-containing protein [Anaerolineales bacterium]|nr:DUF1501 domain-containing protein [Anaerolineales bacterium]
MSTPLSRRSFLQTLAALPASRLASRLSFTTSRASPAGDTLVVVFLRGAADGLNLAPPYGEPDYYNLRPTLGIPSPGDPQASPAERAIDLDGFFGLHPALAPLLLAWQDQRLAIVQACGAPDESRSHFKAQELMERGVSDESGPASGWLGRHLASLDTGSASPLRALALGERPPRSLSGGIPVAALHSITDFHYLGDSQSLAQLRAALAALYTGPGALCQLGRDTLDLLHTLQGLDPASYQPETSLVYPDTRFGQGLKQIAMLIKTEAGLETAAIDLDGWDTHFAQGSVSGVFARLAGELAAGLAAFYADLHRQMSRLSIVVMSEFGRRARENGSLGTDHGHGGVMLVMGGGVLGGKVYGDWPGLGQGQLVGPGDLAVTTDYRDVLAELCAKRLNNPAVSEIFPAYQPTFPGIFVSGG